METCNTSGCACCTCQTCWEEYGNCRCELHAKTDVLLARTDLDEMDVLEQAIALLREWRGL